MAAHKLGTLLLCSILFCELTLVFSRDLPRRRSFHNRDIRRNEHHEDRHRSHNVENRHHRRRQNFHEDDDFDRHFENFDKPKHFEGHRDTHKTQRRNHKDVDRFNHHSREDTHIHKFKAPRKPFPRPSPPKVIGPVPEFKNHRSTFHRQSFHYEVTSPRPNLTPRQGRFHSRSFSTSSSKHMSHRSSFGNAHPFSPSFSSYEKPQPRFHHGPIQVKKRTKSISVSFHQPNGYNKGHYHSGKSNQVSVKHHAKSGSYYQPGSTLYSVKGSGSSHTFATCGSASQYKGFCKSKSAGHYAHPGSLDCYIQCDAWGSGYVRPCAPGTYWAHQGTGPAGFNACVSKKHGFKGNTASQAPKHNYASPSQGHKYTAVRRYYNHDPYGHGHGQGFY